MVRGWSPVGLLVLLFPSLKNNFWDICSLYVLFDIYR